MTLIHSNLYTVEQLPITHWWVVVRVADGQAINFWRTRIAADAEAVRLNQLPTTNQEN